MDPFWTLVTGFWWVAPAAAAATAIGVFGTRAWNGIRSRRLAYDAARLDLRTAQTELTRRKMAVKLTRAEHGRVLAKKAASQAASTDVDVTRRALREAERTSKAASAGLRAQKVRVKAARAEMAASTRSEEMPLARTNAAHNAILARWLDYETDPAKLIAFPAMSDAREPATAVFLSASERARDARLAAGGRRVSVAEFAVYRNAVDELERAFDAAELSARRKAGFSDDGAGERPAGWQDAAQQAFERSAEAVDRVASAAAAALAAWNSRGESRNTNPPSPNR